MTAAATYLTRAKALADNVRVPDIPLMRRAPKLPTPIARQRWLKRRAARAATPDAPDAPPRATHRRKSPPRRSPAA